MSAETRRISRARAKRFKASGQSGLEAASKFERSGGSGFVPEGETRELTTEEFRKRTEEKRAKGKVEVVRKKTAAEVVAMEDRPGVTMPEEAREIFERGEPQAPVKEDMLRMSPEKLKRLQQATIGGLSVAALGGGITAVAARAGGRAAVSRAAAGQVSKKMIQTTLTGARPFIVNTKNAAKTTSWLTRLISTSGVVSAGVALYFANTIIDLIGTYPFAGFVKEESLQTLSLAVRSAIANKDVEGAEIALEAQRELLNPTVWDTIINAIPYANIQKQNKNFYKSAVVKVEVDAKAVESMRERLEAELEPTQPKWIQTADGKWKPNPENEGWQEQNEELVWMGG